MRVGMSRPSLAIDGDMAFRPGPRANIPNRRKESEADARFPQSGDRPLLNLLRPSERPLLAS